MTLLLAFCVVQPSASFVYLTGAPQFYLESGRAFPRSKVTLHELSLLGVDTRGVAHFRVDTGQLVKVDSGPPNPAEGFYSTFTDEELVRVRRRYEGKRAWAFGQSTLELISTDSGRKSGIYRESSAPLTIVRIYRVREKDVLFSLGNSSALEEGQFKGNDPLLFVYRYRKDSTASWATIDAAEFPRPGHLPRTVALSVSGKWSGHSH